MEVTIENPLDMHVHLRDGRMLELVAADTAKQMSGALVMPNLHPDPVMSVMDMTQYKDRIHKALADWMLEFTNADSVQRRSIQVFKPYMTLFFNAGLTKDLLSMAKDLGMLSVKLYPQGVTTNSDKGIDPLAGDDRMYEIFQHLSDLHIPLCVHPETIDDFVLDREREFTFQAVTEWATRFPKLKIIMEHISTAEAAGVVESYENVYATITLHHLIHTLDDVVGGMLQPHNFCKPIPKLPLDRERIQMLVQGGCDKVMLGTDSAPHEKRDKESHCGCAGVFSARYALEDLVQIFYQLDCMEHLQAFASDNAQRIYCINPPKKTVVLHPDESNTGKSSGIFVPNVPVPWRAAERRLWEIKEVRVPELTEA
jgi:dihydroorotase